MSQLVLRPMISYTVANAKDDVGNPQSDLSSYLKISDYETDKENLVSDNELTTTLLSYATNTSVENALDDYATKTLLTESLSNRPTFSTTDEIAGDVSTLTDQLLVTQNALTTHTHTINDVTNLSTTLEGKASSIHNHAISDITDLSTTLASKASSTHTHTMNDITDLTVSSHTHSISDITNLSTTLAGKAASSHEHAVSEIIDLPTRLAGKANSSHTHSIDDITNLTTTLASKVDSSHTHSIGDISNLAVSLAGKAASTHTHTTNDVMVPYEYTVSNETYTAHRGLNEFLKGEYDGTSHDYELKILKPLNSQNAIIGSNVLADNETRLAACENAIATTQTHTHDFSDIKTFKGKMQRYLTNADLTFGTI